MHVGQAMHNYVPRNWGVDRSYSHFEECIQEPNRSIFELAIEINKALDKLCFSKYTMTR